jgi:phosphoribosyl 1,2-cyclic phosphate phosphodiesterase
MVKDTLTFWGTGDSMGVPRVYCSCEVCMEARTTGRNRRFRSSAMLNSTMGELLIDCGPEWRTQMENFGKHTMGHVLITHAHFDHIAGLPEWADACRWQQVNGHLHAPADVLDLLRRMFPWLENQLVYHDCSSGWQWGEWHIQPWKVSHGKNGFSYAYRFDKLGKPERLDSSNRHGDANKLGSSDKLAGLGKHYDFGKLNSLEKLNDSEKLASPEKPYCFAYCPDAINLSDEQRMPLFGLDLLVLGTNFYKEDADIETRSVYDMVEALDLLEQVKPKRTLFTHMSHGVDILQDYSLPEGVMPAQTGMMLELG